MALLKMKSAAWLVCTSGPATRLGIGSALLPKTLSSAGHRPDLCFCESAYSYIIFCISDLGWGVYPTLYTPYAFFHRHCQHRSTSHCQSDHQSSFIMPLLTRTIELHPPLFCTIFSANKCGTMDRNPDDQWPSAVEEIPCSLVTGYGRQIAMVVSWKRE